MGNGFLVDLALKALGSVSGAVLALVFQPPKNRAEFVTRAAFSVISGLIFGDIAREYFKWADTWQMVLAASAATAMLSWFIMGAVVRLIGAWKPKE
jgi:hypothetical protein